jgi:hypothetical protein
MYLLLNDEHDYEFRVMIAPTLTIRAQIRSSDASISIFSLAVLTHTPRVHVLVQSYCVLYGAGSDHTGKVGPPDIGDTHVEAMEGGRLQVLQSLIASYVPGRREFQNLRQY